MSGKAAGWESKIGSPPCVHCACLLWGDAFYRAGWLRRAAAFYFLPVQHLTFFVVRTRYNKPYHRWGEGPGITVIYIDSLFLLNLVLNYLLLLVTAKLSAQRLARVRFGAAAAFGALYAAAVFLPGLGGLAHPLCKAAVGVLVALIAFGHSKRLLRATLLFFVVSAAFGGVMLALQMLGHQTVRLTNGVLYAPMDLKAILLSAAACYCAITLVFSRSAKHSHSHDLLPATLTLDGKTTHLTALVDTGNTMTDPARGGPVMVAEAERLLPLLPCPLNVADPVAAMQTLPDPRRFRLLPYRAVGVDCGMLLAVRVDRAVVGGEDLGNLLVALSPTSVSDGGGYQALLGAQ